MCEVRMKWNKKWAIRNGRILRKSCRNCDNCFDNGEALHFNTCKIHWVCVDCDPLWCEGKDWIPKIYYDMK